MLHKLSSKLSSKISKLHSIYREGDKIRHRSSGWEAVRDAHLASRPTCAACGGTKLLQVHHVVPFHLATDLELVPSNLVTLCMGDFDCHLRLGHGGSFRCYNPTIVEDAEEFFGGSTGHRLLLLQRVRNTRSTNS